MQRQSDFRIAIEPHLLMDRRCIKPELSDSEARIALMRLGYASRPAMADSARRGWFCLTVDPGHEHDVNRVLIDFKVETFVAVEKDGVYHRRGRPRIKRGRVVLGGYVLVNCGIDERAFLGMAALRNVHGVMGGSGSPWRISDVNFNLYKDFIESDEAEPVIDDGLQCGDEVFIKLGPWVDHKGEIVQVDNDTATVEVMLFGRPCPIKLPLAYFDRL